MWSRLVHIGLALIVIALLLGNLAAIANAANDPQENPQIKNPQGCHGSKPNKCNGQCVNLHEDEQNCGRCGNACDSSEVCHNGRCVSSSNNNKATCTDGKKDGKETDIDCGGPTCPACTYGKTCKKGTDCSSGVCVNGYCQLPSCIDGVKNGNEAGVDCGGPCKPCPRKPISGIGNITARPVQIYNPPPSQIQGPPSTTPTYKFVLGTVTVDTARSLQQDTDYASLGVSVNNQIFTPKSKFIGNLLEAQDYAIDLEVGPIPIPDDPNVPVSIAWLIVNSGSAPSNVDYIMDAGTEALLRSYVPGSGSALAFADKYVGGMLTSYCDGTVMADKKTVNGHVIASWTGGMIGINSRYWDIGKYSGTDSATGCGSNSDYGIYWWVERVS